MQIDTVNCRTYLKLFATCGVTMASKDKPAEKSELIALYRLEFYKKQKNWILCKNVCKKPNPKPTKLEPDPPPKCEEPPKTDVYKPSLNDTYNVAKPMVDTVDTEADVDMSAWNNAFVDNGSDKSTSTTPTEQPASAGFNARAPDKSPAEPYAAGRAEPRAASSHCVDVWDRAEQAWIKEGQEYGAKEAFLPAEEARTDSQVLWEHDNSGWTDPVNGCEGGAWPPGVVLGDAERWLRDPDQVSLSGACVAADDSAASFMRGAAAAPHSSEIELDLNESGEVPDVAGLPAAQLACLVARHAAQLRRLMREAAARTNQQKTIASLSLDQRAHPYDLSDERPIRDLPPHLRPLTGSHTDLRELVTRPRPPYRNPPAALLHGNPTGSHVYPKTLPFGPNIRSHVDPKIVGSYRPVLSGGPKTVGSHRTRKMGSCYDLPVYFHEPQFKNPFVAVRDEVPGGYGDPFVTGSFRNVANVERGMGRLMKEKVVGIGMGRPYRL